MKIFKKNLNYMKYFDNIKIISYDDLNNRISIVFSGKENFVFIFDANPYFYYYL